MQERCFTASSMTFFYSSLTVHSSLKILLLGMPGSGKSTLGRRLAAHFAYPFLDLDAAIVARAGRSIPAIFQTEGEVYFRQLEADALREAVARPGPLVLATGGGTPCFHDNLAVLQATGFSLWLDVPIPVLAARLHRAGLAKRPLLAATQPAAAPTPPGTPDALEAQLHETLGARRRFYALAQLRLSDTSLASVLAQLAAAGFAADSSTGGLPGNG